MSVNTNTEFLFENLSQCELREINKQLTCMALKACQNVSLGNEIIFGTNICESIIALDMTKDEILEITEKYDVIWPWSIAYGNSKEIINKKIVKFPLMIVFVRDAKEISFFIKLANRKGFKISVRSGGCCFEGFCIQNEIIIDTSFLNIPITFTDNSVTLSSGTRLGVLYEKLFERNLIIAGGICSQVAIGGLISGGGIGYFIRKFGYTCDSLLEAQIVTGDGKIRTVSKNENPELFIAIKGAGGNNFGVITKVTVETHPINTVVYFNLVFPFVHAAKVINKFQNLSESTSDDLSGIVVNIQANTKLLVINGVWLKSKSELKMLLDNWIKEIDVEPSFYDISIKQYKDVEADFALEAPSIPFSTCKSLFSFNNLSTDQWQSVIDYLVDVPDRLFVGFQIVAMGGRVNNIDPTSSVMVARKNCNSWISFVGYYDDLSLQCVANKYLDNLYSLLDKIISVKSPGGKSVNYINYPQDQSELINYYHYYLPFLKKVKKYYDPKGIFNFSRGIKSKNKKKIIDNNKQNA